ncbi:hypothetical protein GCM10023235_37160 [Kitasatospora terrestris]|uniref:Uncharacterized protein n=1 Tax=Kitasatospora terrestris TaxID=258051 RepID=A0ABP9DS10_9ACTN
MTPLRARIVSSSLGRSSSSKDSTAGRAGTTLTGTANSCREADPAPLPGADREPAGRRGGRLERFIGETLLGASVTYGSALTGKRERRTLNRGPPDMMQIRT